MNSIIVTASKPKQTIGEVDLLYTDLDILFTINKNASGESHTENLLPIVYQSSNVRFIQWVSGEIDNFLEFSSINVQYSYTYIGGLNAGDLYIVFNKKNYPSVSEFDVNVHIILRVFYLTPFTRPVGIGDYGELKYGNGNHLIQFSNIKGNFDKYFTIGVK